MKKELRFYIIFEPVLIMIHDNIFAKKVGEGLPDGGRPGKWYRIKPIIQKY
jgi:hypothetical protein